jgi:hypothetical protein
MFEPTRRWTNSMEQSPSWKANSHPTSQENSCLLWDPKGHSRVHEIPLLVPIPSHLSPVHT